MSFKLAALAASFVFAAALAADAAPVTGGSHPFVAGKTYYAVGVPVCKRVKRGTPAARCFAVWRKEVTKITAGARAFLPASGAAGGNDTIGPAGGLTPADLAKAYSFSTAGGGTQTVAIVDAYNDPNIKADLAAFDAQYGLPACGSKCLTVVNQSGVSGVNHLPPNDTTGWSLEESLDVETVHSVCPNCKIILVETNSNSYVNLAQGEQTAIALGATVVSNSFGGPESGATDSTVQSAFNQPGKVIVASTGDDGFYDYDFLAGTNEPNFPASSSTVVSVGGTTLLLGQTGLRQNETVWNDNGIQDYFEQITGDRLGAGGGGCSLIFTAQPWQTSVPGWSQTGCGTMRLSADVAAVGDYLTGFDVYDTYACASGCLSPGWHTIGGTSLAAPLIASLYALAGGAQGVDYPASILYTNRKSAYDVTMGGDGWCDGKGAAACGNPNSIGYGIVDCDYTSAGAVNVGNGACSAREGYDGPTGVGTPSGLSMFRNATAHAPSKVK
ncbi:MAG TPA: S53 family peptidase [Rhizomicrobium sp.]|jgi:subtilase family serine protease